MKPPSGRRALIVLPATIAGILATVSYYPDTPSRALPLIAGILLVSNLAYPSPTWIRLCGLRRRLTPPAVTRRYRHAVSTIVREPHGPRPAGRVKALLRRWRERAYFHLSRDEHDARTQIGMSLWHAERLAYNLESPSLALDCGEHGQNAGQWDDLEAELWPDGEWVDVIDQVRRDQGWKL